LRNKKDHLPTYLLCYGVLSVLKVPVQFEFINKLNDDHYCKPWLSIEPSRGFIHISQYRLV